MNIFKKTVSFLKEVKQELSKVSWSSKDELIGSTVVVITITATLSIFIGGIDMLLSRILSLMFK